MYNIDINFDYQKGFDLKITLCRKNADYGILKNKIEKVTNFKVDVKACFGECKKCKHYYIAKTSKGILKADKKGKLVSKVEKLLAS